MTLPTLNPASLTNQLMLHFESLRSIHKEFPTCSVQEIVETVKNRITKVVDAYSGFGGIPNRTIVKFTCIVQDNGYSIEMFPYSYPVNHTETGEEDNFNFLFMQSPGDAWELGEREKRVANYVEKRPNCCILIPPNNQDILLEKLSLHGNKTSAVVDHYDHPIVSSLFDRKLPGVPKELVCMIKTFIHQPSFTLNQIVHVYGVLDKPSMDNVEISNCISLDDIIPTIHCIHYEVLSPFKLTNSVSNSSEDILGMAQSLRQEALSCMKSIFHGDEIAAEYFYLSLFSKNNKKIAGVPIASFGLNLISDSFSSSDCCKIAEFVKMIKPITAMLPLNIDSLNKKVWIQPSQDRYESEDHGLCRGEFQAPDGTFILFNECDMTEGTLIDRGVKNIQAIQKAIDFGIVEYILRFGSFEKDCDFNIVVVGKAQSILTLPFVIRVEPSDFDSKQVGISSLSERSGILIQNLFESIQNLPFNISKNMEETIHSDFLQSQKATRENSTPVDDGTLLLKRLTLAENLARSKGLQELDLESWKRAGDLERIRLNRLNKKL